MTAEIVIAMAQANPTVGDVAGNLALARRLRARAADAHLLVLPELFLVGYPPEDLVLKPAFSAACASGGRASSPPTPPTAGPLW